MALRPDAAVVAPADVMTKTSWRQKRRDLAEPGLSPDPRRSADFGWIINSNKKAKTMIEAKTIMRQRVVDHESVLRRRALASSLWLHIMPAKNCAR